MNSLSLLFTSSLLIALVFSDTITCRDDPAINDLCVIDCSSPGNCEYSTLICEEGYDCIIDCTENRACYSSNIKCPSDKDCYVDCRFGWSCIESHVYCPNNGDCNIDCSESEACPYSCIECPMTSGNCGINCEADQSCSGMEILCYLGASDSGNCEQSDIVDGSGTDGLQLYAMTPSPTGGDVLTTTTTNIPIPTTQNINSNTVTTTTTIVPEIDNGSYDNPYILDVNFSDVYYINGSSFIDEDVNGINDNVKGGNNSSSDRYKSNGLLVVIFVGILSIIIGILIISSTFVGYKLYKYYTIKTGKNDKESIRVGLCCNGINDDLSPKPDILRMHSLDTTPPNRSSYYMDKLNNCDNNSDIISIENQDTQCSVYSINESGIKKIIKDGKKDIENSDENVINSDQTPKPTKGARIIMPPIINNGINKINGMMSGMINNGINHQYSRVNGSNITNNNNNKFSIARFLGNNINQNKIIDGPGSDCGDEGKEGEQDDESSFSDTDDEQETDFTDTNNINQNTKGREVSREEVKIKISVSDEKGISEDVWNLSRDRSNGTVSVEQKEGTKRPTHSNDDVWSESDSNHDTSTHTGIVRAVL